MSGILRHMIKEANRLADTMGTREAGEKWGYKPSTISEWCRKGMIPGAEQFKKGSPWQIPKNAPCPKPIKNTDS